MFLCFACGILLTLHNRIRAATVQMFWCLCSFHDVLRRYYRSVVIWCQFFLCKKTLFMDSKCNFAFCIYIYKCKAVAFIVDQYLFLLCHSHIIWLSEMLIKRLDICNKEFDCCVVTQYNLSIRHWVNVFDDFRCELLQFRLLMYGCDEIMNFMRKFITLLCSVLNIWDKQMYIC